MIDSREELEAEVTRAIRLLDYLKKTPPPGEDDWERLGRQTTINTVFQILEESLAFVGSQSEVPEPDALSVVRLLQGVTHQFGPGFLRWNSPQEILSAEKIAA